MPSNHTIAQAKYDKANTRTYGIKLNLTYDADIIEKLALVPSMQGYIKQLIRDDITRYSDHDTTILNTNSAFRGAISPPVEDLLKDSIPYTDNNSNTNRKIFQKNFNELMRITKVKQIDIANYTDVTNKTVSAWATGRGYPRADAMEKLCAFFGIRQSVLTEEHSSSESQEEKLLSIFRSTAQEGKDKMIERAEELKLLYPKRNVGKSKEKRD